MTESINNGSDNRETPPSHVDDCLANEAGGGRVLDCIVGSIPASVSRHVPPSSVLPEEFPFSCHARSFVIKLLGPLCFVVQPC